MAREALSDQRWWREGVDDRELAVTSTVKRLKTEQVGRRADFLRFMRLYGGRQSLGYGVRSYAKFDETSPSAGRLALNVVKNCVNALVAKIGKNKPKATFLTDDGDYELQHRAELLERFTEGLFYETGYYKIAPRILLDACVFGTGILKVYSLDLDDGVTLRCERVFPAELVVDDIEAYAGEPRSLYQTKYIDRWVLAEMYPDLADEIKEAKTPSDDDIGYHDIGYDKRSDQLMVTEGWHLPSGPKAKDGRHVLALNQILLLDEEYKRDKFPFVFLKYDEELLGIWGSGLADQLTGIQLEINRLLLKAQHLMHLLTTTRVFIESGSKVLPAHLNNDAGGLVYYTGQPPVFSPTNGVPPEIFQQIDRLYGKAFEITGISQLAAQSQKPPGLNSGKAIESYNDIESERFLTLGRKYEDMALEVAQQFIELARDIDESEDLDPEAKKLAITWQGPDGIEKIDWADINMKRDEFCMKAFPTSMLPTTPPARLQMVQDLGNAGVIDQDDMVRLLDFPDLAETTELRSAPYKLLQKRASQILRKGDYIGPEPFSNLQLALKFMTLTYERAQLSGVPEDKLELIRRYIADTQALLNPAPEAPATPPPPEAGAAPPTAPNGGGAPNGTPPNVQAPPGQGAPPPPMPPPTGGMMNQAA